MGRGLKDIRHTDKLPYRFVDHPGMLGLHTIQGEKSPVEVSADIMFKATMVDGVYDKDPHKYPDAKKYETLTFTKVLEDRLAVMDGTAATLCRDNKLPILVFDLADPDNIARAVQGENVGTLVYEG